MWFERGMRSSFVCLLCLVAACADPGSSSNAGDAGSPGGGQLGGGLAGAGGAGPNTGGGAGADGGAGDDAGAAFDPVPCTEFGWCWLGRGPGGTVGNTLFDVHGTSANDVWAVGEVGTALHFDGQQWTQVPTGTTATLTGVFARATEDVFVVSLDGQVLHFDGARFLPMPFVDGTPLRAVGGVNSGVLVVGDLGVARLWAGSAWETIDAGVRVNLRNIGGDGPVVVGDSSTMLRWNGSGFTVVDDHPTANLFGVATAMGRTWVVGDDATADLQLAPWDWRPRARTLYPDSRWYDVWAQDDEAWVVGEFSGHSLGVLHFEGGGGPLPGTANQLPLRGVWGSSPEAVWLVGTYGLRLRGSRTGYDTPVVEAYDPHFNTALARDGSLLVAANAGYLVVDGAQRSLRGRAVSAHDVMGLDGLSGDDVWLASTLGAIVHVHDGTSDRYTVPNAPDLFDVYVASASEVVAVGANGVIQRWDGATWTDETVRGPSFLAVAGTRIDDVWAVGRSARVVHRSATGWAVVNPESPGTAYTSVWPTAPGVALVVGPNGAVLRCTPTACTLFSTGPWAVASSVQEQGGDVFVTDTLGQLHRLRAGAGAWSTERVASGPLYGVSVTPTTVLVAGAGGAVLIKDR